MARISSELLNVRQVAEDLHLSKSTVYKLIRDGKLPCVRFSKKILRVPAASLAELAQLAGKGGGG